MRIMACTDGASLGLSGTECSWPTRSSDGTANVTIKVSATQPRMTNSESLRIVRAMKGIRGRSVFMRPSTGEGKRVHFRDDRRLHGCLGTSWRLMTTMPHVNAIITVLPTIDVIPAGAATTVAIVICNDLA